MFFPKIFVPFSYFFPIWPFIYSGVIGRVLGCDIKFEKTVHLIPQMRSKHIKWSNIWPQFKNIITLRLYLNVLKPTKPLHSRFYQFECCSNVRNFLYYLPCSLQFTMVFLKHLKYLLDVVFGNAICVLFDCLLIIFEFKFFLIDIAQYFSSQIILL